MQVSFGQKITPTNFNKQVKRAVKRENPVKALEDFFRSWDEITEKTDPMGAVKALAENDGKFNISV